MQKGVLTAAVLVVVLGMAGTAGAHFGMVIPSDSMVMQEDPREIAVTLSFSHPFEMVGMELKTPKVFSVRAGGETENLLPALQKSQVMGHTAWQASYRIKRPGTYKFFMEPVPYWEPAEDCFIIHYTQAVVAAFGDDEGWGEELGLKTEIVPLSKPYGLYAGNVFQGVVKLDGQPVPFAEVEVEYYNEEREVAAPSDYMVTQTVKADGNGVFTYAVPAAGWWGFAALNGADYQMKKDGEDKDVELGAVIWVQFQPWGVPATGKRR